VPLASTPDLAVALAVAAEPVERSRFVLISAGAALAALFLVIGQLIAARRITRLEKAAERLQAPRDDLDNRIRRLEAARIVSTPEPAELGSLPAEIERLRGELAGLTTWVGELDKQTTDGPSLAPAALAILAPIPAEVDRLSRAVAEMIAQVDAVPRRDASPPAESPEDPEDPDRTEGVDGPEPAANADDERAAPPGQEARDPDEQVAALRFRVARLERLAQRLAQQVAVTRETSDFYAERRNGLGPREPGLTRSAVYVDVFLIPGDAVPALATAPEGDYLLVRRTSGSAPEWGSSSPWQSGNGSHPTPFGQDELAAFSVAMVNRFFDPNWSRETGFWLAPVARDVADLAQRAAESADAWLGVITERPFEAAGLPLVVAPAAALTVIGRDLPLPGDPRFVGVRWLVQFFGVVAEGEPDEAVLTSACVKSLPHDLVAESIAEGIRRALEGVLVAVGRRQVEVPQRPRTRGAAVELEKLKADALRTAGANPDSADDAGGEAQPGDAADVERGGLRRVDQAE
jgi:hypothetical protein